MKKNDLDLIKQELNSNRCKDAEVKRMKRHSPPNVLKKVADTKLSTCNRKFKKLLSEERFQDFKKQEWLLYFQMRYKEANNIGYRITGNQMYIKHYSVITALMKNYEPNDIRNMIDFLFQSEQDMFPKNKISIYHLSAGFLPSVDQNAQLWVLGEYTTTKQDVEKTRRPKRVREWNSTKKKRSRTSSNSAIDF